MSFGDQADKRLERIRLAVEVKYRIDQAKLLSEVHRVTALEEELRSTQSLRGAFLMTNTGDLGDFELCKLADQGLVMQAKRLSTKLASARGDLELLKGSFARSHGRKMMIDKILE